MMFSRDTFYDTVEHEGATVDTGSSQVQNINFIRRICGSFVNNDRIQNLMVLCIFINAAMMGIATYEFVRLDPQIKSAFETVDSAFLVIFTIELILQFIYRGLNLFTDPWLVFDFFIILLSWTFSSMQIIRAFRIFRALRLAGRVKALRDVISAVSLVGPKLLCIQGLLLLVYYISSVVFTSLYKDMFKLGQTEDDYFGGLFRTAFTLFQILCLDDWSQIAREVMVTHPSSQIAFVIYVLLTAFFIVNMMIAVLCDSIATLRTESSDGSITEDIEIPLKAIEVDIRGLEKHMEKVILSQERTAHMIEFFSRQIKMKSEKNS